MLKRLQLDENWMGDFTHPQAIRKMKRYYRLLREVYPHIPPKLQVTFTSRLPGAIADVGHNEIVADMRFSTKYLKLYKLVVREFLHEMVHVIWPKMEHGARFEQRMFRLRRQLFHDSMIIY